MTRNEIKKIKIIYKKIEDITPYINNPRKNDGEALEKVASSIKEFGFKNPIVIDKNNTIINGHTRYKAAKKLGMEEVPTISAEDLTPAQIKAFRIADNKTSEYSEWDEDLLKIELEELKELDFKLDETGFESFELENIFDQKETGEVEEDNFDEGLVITKCKEGETWKLGKHFLHCGDSFKTSTFETLLKEIKSDLCFCDPPYDLEKDEWINNIKFNKEGAPILLMAGDKQTVRLTNKIPNFRQFIIHDREQAMLVNTATPMSQHTIISLFCDHPKKYFKNLNDHFTSVIKCKKNYTTAGDELHSKMGKPIKVIAELISHYSKKEDIILDMFGGGGSMIIACEQLNRVCYCNELLAEQCDIIISRWEQFTGEEAEKIN